MPALTQGLVAQTPSRTPGEELRGGVVRRLALLGLALRPAPPTRPYGGTVWTWHFLRPLSMTGGLPRGARMTTDSSRPEELTGEGPREGRPTRSGGHGHPVGRGGLPGSAGPPGGRRRGAGRTPVLPRGPLTARATRGARAPAQVQRPWARVSGASPGVWGAGSAGTVPRPVARRRRDSAVARTGHRARVRPPRTRHPRDAPAARAHHAGPWGSRWEPTQTPSLAATVGTHPSENTVTGGQDASKRREKTDLVWEDTGRTSRLRGAG